MTTTSDDIKGEFQDESPSINEKTQKISKQSERDSRIRGIEILTAGLPGVVPDVNTVPEPVNTETPAAINSLNDSRTASPAEEPQTAATTRIRTGEQTSETIWNETRTQAGKKGSPSTSVIAGPAKSRGWAGWMWVLSGLAVVSILIKISSLPYPWSREVNTAIKDIILVSIAIDAALRLMQCRTFPGYLKNSFFDLPLLACMLAWWSETSLVKGLFIIRQSLTLFVANENESLLSGMTTRLRMNPAQIILSTFLGLIFVGTVLLMLPYSSGGTVAIGFVDALFTSASATCVTGLVTLDTGTQLSRFGQVVTMILFQIGGLGIMTLSAAVAVIFSKRMNLKDQAVMHDMVDPTEGDIVTLLKYILKYTLLIEAIGAAILTAAFVSRLSENPAKALYFGIFHSISAFCNAGFGLLSDSLAGFQNSAAVNFTIMALIILGGLGFSVLLNLHEIFTGLIKGERKRLNLHSRFVLATSAILTVAGFLFFAAAEWNRAFAELPVGDKFLAAAFQSVTCRTAGFSTVDIGLLSPASLLFAIMLMFVGASPGSTGGGIKTTTLAVLTLRVRALLSGRTEVEAAGRTIPQVILHRSISIIFLSGLICFIFLLVLTWTENQPFLQVFFETISAFGTVGLSCGMTPKLTVPGKLLITLLMFIGRIGPLTLALAIGERQVKGAFSFPEEKVMVG